MDSKGRADRIVVWPRPEIAPDHVVGRPYEGGLALGEEEPLESREDAEQLADLWGVEREFIRYDGNAEEILEDDDADDA
ncbi:hypothetical protein [Streptacidiphilus albus]|uniref:hypothetical protein n=1 Tax=Streptacidiphilus albus TaxID=105425 RepID=UPI00054BFA1A|nr:hypothetical protein [Streptacidiphilus albus]